MKRCPLCQDAPDWHFCHHVTTKRADGHRYYLFTGCCHAMSFLKPMVFVAEVDMPAYEARWDAEAELLFSKCTERWTVPQRTSYRARLFRETPAAELELQ